MRWYGTISRAIFIVFLHFSTSWTSTLFVEAASAEDDRHPHNYVTKHPTTYPSPRPTPYPTLNPTPRLPTNFPTNSPKPTEFPTFPPTNATATVSPTSVLGSAGAGIPPNEAGPDDEGGGDDDEDDDEDTKRDDNAWKRWMWVCLPMIVIIVFGVLLSTTGWGEGSEGWGVAPTSWGREEPLRKMGGVYEKSALRNGNEHDYVTFARESHNSRTQWRDMNYNRRQTESKTNSEAYGLANDGFYYPNDAYMYMAMSSNTENQSQAEAS
mmetsp:Transcript_21544/g.34030  ORF Transcript_21544/g.34030 Transcript_21544/m.34030 type:complete len:267 (-) Transcript_21544:54-854(-)